MGKSSGKFSEFSRSDAMTYRQTFAAMWRDFIHESFDDPVHVARAFRVDSTTAKNWWAGSNAPQGWVVARALSDPTLRDRCAAHIAAE